MKLPLSLGSGLKLISARVLRIQGARPILFVAIEDSKSSLTKFEQNRKVSSAMWAAVSRALNLEIDQNNSFDALGYFIDETCVDTKIENGLVFTSPSRSPYWSLEVGREILVRVGVERALLYWSIQKEPSFVSIFRTPLKAAIISKWPVELLFDREYARYQFESLRESLNLHKVRSEQEKLARQWWTVVGSILALFSVLATVSQSWKGLFFV